MRRYRHAGESRGCVGGEILNRGSEWRRWEPHIRVPGTMMNNQFSGPNAWHDYLATASEDEQVINQASLL